MDNNVKNWVDRQFLLERGIPDTFIRKFVELYDGTETRKLGAAKQAKRLYNLEAVNRAITDGTISTDK